MGMGYQRADRNIIDYKLWVLPDVDAALRGPRRWRGDRPFLTFLGAAQTFGRFTPTPFAQKISSIMGVDHINFGSAGAGPEYYLNKEPILDYVNKSAFCVIQIMSGRSVSTSILESLHGGGQLRFRTGARVGEVAMAADAYRLLASEYGAQAALDQAAEARESWIAGHRKLLNLITVPVILLWMSTRAIDTDGGIDAAGKLGEFPQLVGRKEVDAISRGKLFCVEAVVKQPTYIRLVNAFTGDPCEGFDRKTHPNYMEWARDLNVYYYTQSQHDETATALLLALLNEKNKALQRTILACPGPMHQVA